MDNIVHFGSNNRTENAKVLFILPPGVPSGKGAIKVLSKNHFLEHGVLWKTAVFIVQFTETITTVSVSKDKVKAIPFRKSSEQCFLNIASA